MESKSGTTRNHEGRRRGVLTHALAMLTVLLTFGTVVMHAPPQASAAPEVYGVLAGATTHDGGGYGYTRWEGARSARANVGAERLTVYTGHGPAATLESANGSARFWTPFKVDRPTTKIDYSVSWKGELAASLGFDASASVKVTIRVFEVLAPDSEVPRRGPEIWTRVLLDESTDAQLLERDLYDGFDIRLADLNDNTLVPGKSYRVELVLECASEVDFSAAGTFCDFHWAPHTECFLIVCNPAEDNGFGVYLNHWRFPADEQPACGDFDDVASGQWYSDAVEWAGCYGVTSGTSPTTFSPNNLVTRGQLATMLWRQQGSPTGYSHSFSDVPSTGYFHDAVAWMAAEGITTGTSPTTFSPDDVVSRAQLATFLWRHAINFDLCVSRESFGVVYSCSSRHSFADVPSGSYFEAGVGWMTHWDITTGTSATTYSPHQSVTRAQAVTFLHRYHLKPDKVVFGSDGACVEGCRP